MDIRDIIKTKYPIIQGGMANIATGEFAAAISNAGGLGLIAAGGMKPEQLRENIDRARELTDKPFGVNIMLMHPQVDELMAVSYTHLFEFPKNFDFPYISRSFTEFWRRWHMTLGSWFREYLYIPLGGNRVSRPRLYFNLFVVWAATGFWHGASWNFIFWGLFFFVFLVIERMGFKQVLERHSAFSHVYVIFFLLLSWALFAVTDLGMLGDLFTRMFVPVGGVDWIYYLRNYIVVFILGTVLSTPALKGLYLRLEKNNVFCLIFFGAIFLASTAYLVDATYNPFLYFRF